MPRAVNGAVVYSATLVLVIGANGAGTTEVIDPPKGECVATLEIQKGRSPAQAVDTIQFTVV